MFHARGPAAAKDRSPSDDVVRGTATELDATDLRPVAAADGVIRSARYDGASPYKQRCTIIHSLYSTRCLTITVCNETDTGVPQTVFVCFPNAVWASASGAFRIVSDTLVHMMTMNDDQNNTMVQYIPSGGCRRRRPNHTTQHRLD